MKERIGKVSIAVLLVVVISLLIVNLMVQPLSARPIVPGNQNAMIGNFTGPIGGTAQDDNIKASLDLAHTDLDTIIADTSAMDTAAEMALLTGTPITISDTTSAMTAGNGYGAADDPTIFTVTGDILCRAAATITTQVTSTSNDTLELGVPGNTAALLIQDVADGTAFDAGDTWTLITAADADGAQMADEWLVVKDGNIILTINDHDLTAGVVNFYLQYIPLSSGATVVGAAP